jgi:dolichol-phosphate mannosyltransferase
MPKVVVVVPTYNESGNIARLVEAIFAQPVPDLQVLIVDDNSPDGTGKIVDELVAESGGKLHIIHRSGKLGLGTAYIQGFKWALANGAEYILQMDADFSHDPSYIPQLVKAADNADAVIGSRYIKGGRLDEEWSVWRKLLSWWANRVWVGFSLQLPVRDATAGFRLWKRRTLIGMDLDRVRSNGYVFQVEITYIASRLGYNFVEVPIYFKDRRGGESKMSFKIQVEAALAVFRLLRHYSRLTPSQRASGG